MAKKMALELIGQRILRLCHAGLDSRTFQIDVMAALLEAVPADAWRIGTVDPATLMMTSAFGEGFPRDKSARFLQIEYAEEDFNKFADLARRKPPVGLLIPATGGELEKSARWREICHPAGLRDELRAALVIDGVCWGGLDLARKDSAPDFSQQEAAYVADLSAPIAAGLRASLVIDRPHIQDAVFGPGLVILSDDMEPEAISSAAEGWLGRLRELQSSWMGPLPSAVYAVATKLREFESAAEVVSDLLPRVRVQLRGGQWLAVQASRLNASSGKRQIAVILEAAVPSEVAPLIVSAYSLTERETEIAQLVLQGLSTKEIASTLFVSPSTVQQHLQVIFGKVGVRSRRELVSQVFEQPYWPRISSGAVIGTSGWFVEPASAAN